MDKAYAIFRNSALKKVGYVNEMASAPANAVRESAFEALCCEILDAFAAYPTLESVSVNMGKPVVNVFDEGDTSLNVIVTILHSPTIETKGAFVTEWDSDLNTFISEHLPLAKMGSGRFTVERTSPEVQSFLLQTTEDYMHYRSCVALLMMKANMSFGSQHVDNIIAA